MSETWLFYIHLASIPAVSIIVAKCKIPEQLYRQLHGLYLATAKTGFIGFCTSLRQESVGTANTKLKDFDQCIAVN